MERARLIKLFNGDAKTNCAMRNFLIQFCILQPSRVWGCFGEIIKYYIIWRECGLFGIIVMQMNSMVETGVWESIFSFPYFAQLPKITSKNMQFTRRRHAMNGRQQHPPCIAERTQQVTYWNHFMHTQIIRHAC